MHKNELKKYTKVKEAMFDEGSVELYCKQDEFVICRRSTRGNITNFLTRYELIDGTVSHKLLIDLEHGIQIVDRIAANEKFSDALIFYKNKKTNISIPALYSEQEDKFTSTGVKFWRHKEQMHNYRNGNANTVISTHISPEGACNLKCSYCSVTYRNTHSRIPLPVIQQYVLDLKTVGLRAVILTGGGEPTMYKHFNELVRWLHAQGLSIGLVTNGIKTNWSKVDDDVCKMFTWVRVSINIFEEWETQISLPVEKFDTNKTLIGCSMVYTIENDDINADYIANHVNLLSKVSKVADNCGGKYIRMLPNCLLKQDNLIYQHKLLNDLLQQISDPRFFHQFKVHETPKSNVCHQSYFRPYLSEEIHKKTGLPGTVYPCDSVVLNDGKQFYSEGYQLCHASEILGYLNKSILPEFNPREKCQGCVHTKTINMLEDWVHDRVDRFDDFLFPIVHENFV